MKGNGTTSVIRKILLGILIFAIIIAVVFFPIGEVFGGFFKPQIDWGVLCPHWYVQSNCEEKTVFYEGEAHSMEEHCKKILARNELNEADWDDCRKKCCSGDGE